MIITVPEQKSSAFCLLTRPCHLTIRRGLVPIAVGDVVVAFPGLQPLVQQVVGRQATLQLVRRLQVLQLQQVVLDGVTEDAVVPLRQHRHPVRDVHDGCSARQLRL